MRSALRRCAPAVIGAVLVLVSFCAAAVAGAASLGAQGTLHNALEKLVLAKDGPPGAIVVVQHGRTTSVITAGTAVAGMTTTLAATDHIRIASVSKAYSGAAALALVARGKLSLDDTIGKILPSLPRAWASVTLEELLHHTSGVPDFSASPEFQKAVVASLQSPPSPEQLLSYVSTEPLNFAPGSRYEYSNSDNVIVALMTQAVTGLGYDAVLEQFVFGPLGLSETSLPVSSALPDPFIHGYAPDPPGAPEDVSTLIAAGWAWASGGIVSTPADTNRFARAYARGATTDRSTRAQQFTFIDGATSEPPGPGANAAGLAIFRYRTPCGTVYGHTGNTSGYTQFMAASPNGANSVSVTVNEQISPNNGATKDLFPQLRQVFELGVCAALAG